MACSSHGMPFGIQQLMGLNHLMVRQKTTMFSNKYVVTVGGGKEILYVKEDSTRLHSMLGSDRSFHMDICDAQDNQIIALRRPYTLGPDKLEVIVCGELASIIRRKFTFLKPVFTINSPADEPVLRIKGSIWNDVQCDFNIYTIDKTHIGTIRKKWGGWKRDLLCANEFDIEFPMDLDVRYKAAVLGACMLIDFVLYED